MRISSDENSKYYNKELGLSPKVYLDGELVKYAMEADDVAGWVKCCKLNEKGDAYAEENEIVTEILHGKIKIKIKEEE